MALKVSTLKRRRTNLLPLPGIEPHSSVVKLVALSLLPTQLSDYFIILVEVI
jgi:hypothetical protein